MQVAAAVNAALQLSLLILWSLSFSVRTPTSVPAAALGFVNAAMILCLSYIEDRKSTRPSSLLIGYLVLSVFFDATQVRTLWLTRRDVIAAVQSTSIGMKVAMLVLEARPKVSYLKSPYREYPPESTSGILNLSLVWWLNRLFLAGYRKLIATQDLFDVDPVFRSTALEKRMRVAWERHGSASFFFFLPLIFNVPAQPLW